MAAEKVEQAPTKTVERNGQDTITEAAQQVIEMLSAAPGAQAPSTIAEAAASGVPMKWNASAEHLALLKRTLVDDNVTDDEFRLFILIGERMNLDPFKRQIYAVKYKDDLTIQTGIDGYRAIAVRTGKYGGQDAPIYYDHRGDSTPVWLDEKQPPTAVVIRVYRKDVDRPFVGIAMFSEYARRRNDGSLTSMWKAMPSNQLAKCAEALALRKAFPDELAGVYTADEMDQAAGRAETIETTGRPGRAERVESPVDAPSKPKKRSLSAEPALKPDDREEVTKAWRAAKPEAQGKAIEFLIDRDYHGKLYRRQWSSAEKKWVEVSERVAILTDFNLNAANGEQVNALIGILAGYDEAAAAAPVPERPVETPQDPEAAPASNAGFDPDAIGRANGEVPPPDAPAATDEAGK